MECLRYKGGCDIRKCMRIEMFKSWLGWAIDKRLLLIINTMLFKTVLPLRI